MKAGRELDALIAEKVMGELGKLRQSEYNLMLPHDVLLPNYSTQIQDAWLVVEKMRKDGFYICLMNDGHGGRVWLSLHSAKEGTWDTEGNYDKLIAEIDYVESAPLAICLAALKAVGVEDE